MNVVKKKKLLPLNYNQNRCTLRKFAMFTQLVQILRHELVLWLEL